MRCCPPLYAAMRCYTLLYAARCSWAAVRFYALLHAAIHCQTLFYAAVSRKEIISSIEDANRSIQWAQYEKRIFSRYRNDIWIPRLAWAVPNKATPPYDLAIFCQKEFFSRWQKKFFLDKKRNFFKTKYARISGILKCPPAYQLVAKVAGPKYANALIVSNHFAKKKSFLDKNIFFSR